MYPNRCYLCTLYLASPYRREHNIIIIRNISFRPYGPELIVSLNNQMSGEISEVCKDVGSPETEVYSRRQPELITQEICVLNHHLFSV